MIPGRNLEVNVVDEGMETEDDRSWKWEFVNVHIFFKADTEDEGSLEFGNNNNKIGYGKMALVFDFVFCFEDDSLDFLFVLMSLKPKTFA